MGYRLAWGRSCGGASQEEPAVREGAEAAAAPPIDGGQLSGDAASPPLARAEEEALRAERPPFGTKLPPRGASPMMLAAAAQQDGIIAITVAIAIGGGVAIDSFPVIIPCSAGTSPDTSCSCRLGEQPRAPQHDIRGDRW